jgi:hypothetical protein
MIYAIGARWVNIPTCVLEHKAGHGRKAEYYLALRDLYGRSSAEDNPTTTGSEIQFWWFWHSLGYFEIFLRSLAFSDMPSANDSEIVWHSYGYFGIVLYFQDTYTPRMGKFC